MPHLSVRARIAVISDLRNAAKILEGKKVAAGVNAICVPGSSQVKKAAEAEGLDKIFKAAGFEWRESGCSMCFFAGGENFGLEKSVVSSTNRNFENRQGPRTRTHLASPTTVAASAIKAAYRRRAQAGAIANERSSSSSPPYRSPAAYESTSIRMRSFPSREMKRVSKQGLSDGLFAGWRYTAPGSREENQEFILNQAPYRQAEILLSGMKFRLRLVARTRGLGAGTNGAYPLHHRAELRRHFLWQLCA